MTTCTTSTRIRKAVAVALLLVFLLLFTGVAAANDEVYDSPGTYTWTAPNFVANVTVEVWGAQGESGSVSTGETGAGGSGGYTNATFNLSEGDELFIRVGAQGGGGDGGSIGDAVGGDGGEWSYARLNVDDRSNTIIASGGGGGGGAAETSEVPDAADGGAGGNDVAEDGGNADAGGGGPGADADGGTGGDQSSGGDGGDGDGAGTDGEAGSGGDGGAHDDEDVVWAAGGGGGDGWFGGGGGGAEANEHGGGDSAAGAGGGGGSNVIDTGVEEFLFTSENQRGGSDGDGKVRITWTMHNAPPIIHDPVTYNGTDYANLEAGTNFVRDDVVTFRANITDETMTVSSANISVFNTTGDLQVENVSMTNISEVTVGEDDGYTFEYNFPELDENSDIGEWSFTIWAEDTEGLQSSTTGNFNVYVPAILNISFWETETWQASLFDTLTLTANVTCVGEEDDAECGQVTGDLLHGEYDDVPEGLVSSVVGDDPFFVDPGVQAVTESSGWWTANNTPDLHVQRVESVLTPDEGSWTNITVNASNFGQGAWNVNVSLWDVTVDHTKWSNETVYDTGTTSGTVALGDVFGDGKMDIVSGDNSDNVLVHRYASGEWSDHVVYNEGYSVYSVALGDVFGDGKMEIVSGHRHGAVRLHRNVSGGWSNDVVYEAEDHVQSVAVGDVFGDGKLEIVAGTEAGNLTLHRNVSGGWTNETVYDAGSSFSDIYSVSLGDVYGDGQLEIVSGDRAHDVQIHRNVSGGWTNETVYEGPGSPRSVAIGDIWNDGTPNIVSGHSGDNTIQIHRNVSGGWTNETAYTGADWVKTLSLGDITGNGQLEIVSGNRDDTVRVHQNISGGWNNILAYSTDDDMESVALGDVFGDGRLEIATAGRENLLQIHQTDGSSTFLGSNELSFTNVNGTGQQANISWAPEAKEYNLVATADHHRNYTSVFRTQDDGGAQGERLAQQIDLRKNPRFCDTDPLTHDQTCSLSWTVNATERGEYNLGVNFSSDADWIEYNMTESRKVETEPGFLNITFWDTTTVETGLFDVFEVVANVSCVAKNDYTECGSVDGALQHGEYDDVPDDLVPVEGGEPFFIDEGVKTFFNESSGWWNYSNRPDLHLRSMNSSLLPGEPGWTNVTVNASNWQFGTWDVNVSLWDVNGSESLLWNGTDKVSGTGHNPDIAMGDVTGNGRLEAVSVTSSGSNIGISIWNVTGNGDLERMADPAGDAKISVSLGDVTGDGRLEAVTGGGIGNHNISVRTWDTGAEDWSVLFTEEFMTWPEVVTGDVRNDGTLDVIAGGGTTEGNLSVFEWVEGEERLRVVETANATDRVVAISSGDVTGDGQLDIVTGTTTGNLTVWGYGASGLQVLDTVMVSAEAVNDIVLGDVFGDGSLEVVIGNGEGEIKIFEWEDQLVESSTVFDDAEDVRAVSLGDVSGDGRLDMLSGADDKVLVHWNQGDGSFETKTVQETGEEKRSIALGDLNDDGRLDVLSGGSDGKLFLNWQEGYSRLIGSDELSFTDANGTAGQANISWIPDSREYNLVATVDHHRNYTSVFRTQGGSSAVGERLVQKADLRANPLLCDTDNLKHDDPCQLTWTVNATERGAFNLGVNFTGADWMAYNLTQPRRADVGIGELLVDLDHPFQDLFYAVQHDTFWLNASIRCVGEEGDTCGDVTGSARYNESTEPDVLLPEEEGSPFHINGTAKAGIFQNASTGWWTAGNAPDIHLHSLNSSLDPGVESTTNVTINVSNYGLGTWPVNVSLWNVDTFDSEWVGLKIGETGNDIIQTVTGDVLGDDHTDMVSVDSAGNIDLWENPRDGTSNWNRISVGSVGAWLNTVAVADISGDGRLDIVTAGHDDAVTLWENPGDGTGSWDATEIYISEGNALNAVKTGDVTGNGSIDIVSGDNSGNLILHKHPGEGYGDGNWETVTIDESSAVNAITLGDISRDGRLDVARTGSSAEGIHIFWNPGTYDENNWDDTDVGTTGFTMGAIAAADVVGNGTLDLVTGDASNDIILWRHPGGDGAGEWEDVVIGNAQGAFGALALADVSGNNFVDIVSGGGEVSNEKNMIWENSGDGTGDWENTTVGPVTDRPNTLAIGDITGDGAHDLITGNDNNISYWHRENTETERLTSTVHDFTNPAVPGGVFTELADSYEIIWGTHQGGTIEDTHEEDGNTLDFEPENDAIDVSMHFDTDQDPSAASKLVFEVRARTNEYNDVDITMDFRIWNFEDEEWHTAANMVNETMYTHTRSICTVGCDIGDDPADYINETGDIKTRYSGEVDLGHPLSDLFIDFQSVHVHPKTSVSDTVSLSWTPEADAYNLLAVADPARNHSSVFRTQGDSNSVGNRLIQSVDLGDVQSNPLPCPDELTAGDTCDLSWPVNGTGVLWSQWLLDVNVTSSFAPGIPLVETGVQPVEIVDSVLRTSVEAPLDNQGVRPGENVTVDTSYTGIGDDVADCDATIEVVDSITVFEDTNRNVDVTGDGDTDTVEWTVQPTAPGVYDVNVSTSCGNGVSENRTVHNLTVSDVVVHREITTDVGGGVTGRDGYTGVRLTVENRENNTITGLELEENVPFGLLADGTIENVWDGGSVEDGTITWKQLELHPGQVATFAYVLDTGEPVSAEQFDAALAYTGEAGVARTASEMGVGEDYLNFELDFDDSNSAETDASHIGPGIDRVSYVNTTQTYKYIITNTHGEHNVSGELNATLAIPAVCGEPTGIETVNDDTDAAATGATYSDGKILWENVTVEDGPLQPGTSAAFRFDLDCDTAGYLNFTASGVNGTFDYGKELHGVVVRPDLVFDRANPDTVAENASFTVGLDVENSGAAASYLTELRDIYPNEFEVQDSGGGEVDTYNATHQEIVWSVREELGPQDSTYKQYTLKAPDDPDLYGFVSEWNYQDRHDTWFNNSDQYSIEVVADVARLDVSVDPGTVNASQDVQVTVEVSNPTIHDATDVATNITLPEDWGAPVNIDPSDGSVSVDGNTVKWDGFSVDDEDVENVTFDTTASKRAGGNVIATETVYTSEGEKLGDTTDAVVQVNAPDIVVDRQLPGTVGVGRAFTSTITVENPGTAEAVDLEAIEQVCENAPGDCSVNTSQAAWELDGANPDTRACDAGVCTYEWEAEDVNATLDDGTNHITLNISEIGTGDTYDLSYRPTIEETGGYRLFLNGTHSDPWDNQYDTDTEFVVTVAERPFLEMDLDAGEEYTNETVEYTWTVTNTGTEDANESELWLTIPAGFDVDGESIDETAGDATLQNGLIHWDLTGTDIAEGGGEETVTVDITTAETRGAYTFTSNTSYRGAEHYGAYTGEAVFTAELLRPSLQVSRDMPSQVDWGQSFTVDLSLVNNGDLTYASVARGINLTETLHDSFLVDCGALEAGPFTTTDCSDDSMQVNWSDADIDPGASGDASVAVETDRSGTYTFSADAEYSDVPGNLFDVSTQSSVTVRSGLNLLLENASRDVYDGAQFRLFDDQGGQMAEETLGGGTDAFRADPDKYRNHTVEVYAPVQDAFFRAEILDYNATVREVRTPQLVAEYSGAEPGDVEEMDVVYAFDATGLEYNEVNLTFPKLGLAVDRIASCDNWDWDTPDCTGEWTVNDTDEYSAETNDTHVWFTTDRFSAYSVGSSDDDPLFAGGSGTWDDPYQIADWYHLNNTRMHLDANFTLLNELNTTTDGYDELASETANSGMGWEPVGVDGAAFTGTLTGDGYAIAEMRLDRDTEQNGLFGVVDGGNVTDLVVQDVDVSGSNETGAVTGYGSDVTVSNVNVTGNVTGNILTGGIAGLIDQGSWVEYSHADIFVNGTGGGTGGLLGRINNWATVFESSAAGEVVSSSRNNGGLVGLANDVSVINRSYATASVDAGNRSAGGLVGYHGNSALTVGSWASGNVTSTSDRVGGLVGSLRDDSRIETSYATGDVNSSDIDVGGLIGRTTSGDPVAVDSYATGNVYSGDDYAGGFIGRHRGGVINRSYATGNAEAAERWAGGFAGAVRGDAVIVSSYATGNATVSEEGDHSAGGFVGRMTDTAMINDSYATGNADSPSVAGGFVAWMREDTRIYRSYSTGEPSASSSEGGFLGGQANENEEVHDSFWDNETSGTDTSAEGTGKPTAEMQSIDTFTDTATEGLENEWDMVVVAEHDGEVWKINDGNDYPRLGWEDVDVIETRDVSVGVEYGFGDLREFIGFRFEDVGIETGKVVERTFTGFRDVVAVVGSSVSLERVLELDRFVVETVEYGTSVVREQVLDRVAAVDVGYGVLLDRFQSVQRAVDVTVSYATDISLQTGATRDVAFDLAYSSSVSVQQSLDRLVDSGVGYVVEVDRVVELVRDGEFVVVYGDNVERQVELVRETVFGVTYDDSSVFSVARTRVTEFTVRYDSVVDRQAVMVRDAVFGVEYGSVEMMSLARERVTELTVGYTGVVDRVQVLDRMQEVGVAYGDGVNRLQVVDRVSDTGIEGVLSVTRQAVLVRDVAEIIVYDPVVSTVDSLTRGVETTVGYGDTVVRQFVGERMIAAGLGVSDVVERQVESVREAVTQVGAVTGFDRQLEAVRDMDTAVSVTESVHRSVVSFRTVTVDVVYGFETVFVTAETRFVDLTVQYTDVVERQTVLMRDVVFDAGYGVDAVASAARERGVETVVTFADAVDRVSILDRAVAADIGYEGLVERVQGLERAVTVSVATVDEAVRETVVARAVDTAAVWDVAVDRHQGLMETVTAAVAVDGVVDRQQLLGRMVAVIGGYDTGVTTERLFDRVAAYGVGYDVTADRVVVGARTVSVDVRYAFSTVFSMAESRVVSVTVQVVESTERTVTGFRDTVLTVGYGVEEQAVSVLHRVIGTGIGVTDVVDRHVAGFRDTVTQIGVAGAVEDGSTLFRDVGTQFGVVDVVDRQVSVLRTVSTDAVYGVEAWFVTAEQRIVELVVTADSAVDRQLAVFRDTALTVEYGSTELFSMAEERIITVSVQYVDAVDRQVVNVREIVTGAGVDTSVLRDVWYQRVVDTDTGVGTVVDRQVDALRDMVTGVVMDRTVVREATLFRDHTVEVTVTQVEEVVTVLDRQVDVVVRFVDETVRVSVLSRLTEVPVVFAADTDRQFTGSVVLEQAISVTDTVEWDHRRIRTVETAVVTAVDAVRHQSLVRTVDTTVFTLFDWLHSLFVDDDEEPDPTPTPTPPPPEPDPEPDIDVNTSERVLKLAPGDSELLAISGTNNGTAQGLFHAAVTGNTTHFLSPDAESTRLLVNESAAFQFTAAIPDDTGPGVFNGAINVSVGQKSRSVPVTVIVTDVEEDELLDVRMDLVSRTLEHGEPFQYLVEIFNMGETDRVDIDMITTVRDDHGTIILQESEMMAVDTSISLARRIDEPLEPGNYTVELVAEYADLTANASARFTVVPDPAPPQIQTLLDDHRVLAAIGLLAAILLAGTGMYAYRTYRGRKRYDEIIALAESVSDRIERSRLTHGPEMKRILVQLEYEIRQGDTDLERIETALNELMELVKQDERQTLQREMDPDAADNG